MNKLQTYFGVFLGFVTAWITDAGTMFATNEPERERERERERE
jgi:hypothetical protein